MPKINGTLIAVLSGADKILHSKNATLTVAQNLFDTTTKESAGWAEHGNGLRNWEITWDGLYDEAGSGITQNEIIGYIIARTADTVIKFVTNSPTNTVGWTGNGTFQTGTIGGPMEDASTSSARIQGNGALAPL